jgi:hypothetical protein
MGQHRLAMILPIFMLAAAGMAKAQAHLRDSVDLTPT